MSPFTAFAAGFMLGTVGLALFIFAACRREAEVSWRRRVEWQLEPCRCEHGNDNEEVCHQCLEDWKP